MLRSKSRPLHIFIRYHLAKHYAQTEYLHLEMQLKWTDNSCLRKIYKNYLKINSIWIQMNKFCHFNITVISILIGISTITQGGNCWCFSWRRSWGGLLEFSKSQYTHTVWFWAWGTGLPEESFSCPLHETTIIFSLKNLNSFEFYEIYLVLLLL